MKLIPNIWPFRRAERLEVQTGDTPKPSTTGPGGAESGKSVLRQQFSTYLRGQVEQIIGVFNPQLVDTNRRLQMRDDPDVAFGLAILRSAIINAQWTVESNDPEIKAALTAELRRGYRQLAKAGSNAIGLGYQVIEKVWEARSMTVEVEDGEGGAKTEKTFPVIWGFKEFKAIDPRTIILHVNEETDEWDGVQQWVVSSMLPQLQEGIIGTDRVALWTYRKDDVFGRLTGYAQLDNAYTAWWDKQAISMFGNRYFERRADPTPVARAEATAFDENGRPIDGIAKMAEIVSNIKNGGSVVLPIVRDEHGEYKNTVDFLKDDKRGDMYESFIAHKSQQILRGLLTPDRVGTAPGNGSLGSGESKTHQEVSTEFLESIAYDWFEELVNPQVARPWGIFNFGEERYEKSNTRVVVSGISESVKSLLKEVLFKAMDYEASAGAGKSVPIAKRISSGDILDTIGAPQVSADELAALEKEAIEEAAKQEQALKDAAAAPAPNDQKSQFSKESPDLLTLERLKDDIVGDLVKAMKAGKV